ncbi:DUF2750 domain-containing protein [Neobacillus massiliamazoniensis]|uniref:Uncharacterized protein n=1 Tax=Neobacillus massiliamazoniensis TaxID=1499688 RepID=A0A0U1P338_9BACI|nr:DUF2750 domain-containing protein [Neobacillus massiliamazoniensis]CRK84754.1 hypothetical protein BN000_04804 [Neobacillus massiliamazoniensis]
MYEDELLVGVIWNAELYGGEVEPIDLLKEL